MDSRPGTIHYKRPFLRGCGGGGGLKGWGGNYRQVGWGGGDTMTGSNIEIEAAVSQRYGV